MRPLGVPFRLNGRVYTRLFAWRPMRTSQGEWFWLTSYYVRSGRYGQLVLSSCDFQLDTMHG